MGWRLPVLLNRRSTSTGADAPTYSSSEIGDVSPEAVMVRLSKAVTSPGADYLAGVTIKLNAVTEAFETGVRQTDHAYILYTNDADFADANDVVTWEYDDDAGDIEAEVGGAALADVAAQTVENRVGMHLYFDNDEELVWMAAL